MDVLEQLEQLVDEDPAELAFRLADLYEQRFGVRPQIYETETE